MKKTNLLLVISVILIMMLAACSSETSTDSENNTESSNSSDSSSASEDESKEKFKIGVTHYGLQNEFTVLIAEAQKEKAAELGVEIEVFDGNYDPATQLSQFENMIAQGYDAIIFSPVDVDALAVAVEAATDAGVPVFGVNTKVNSDLLTSYVGSNDVDAGEIEMQWMADKLGGKGNIVIIEGPLGSSAQVQRKQGIYNILEKYPDIKVLAIQTGNWQRSEGLMLMENWLQAFPGEINGVVAQNDEMALGAINSLEEAGLKDSIPVVGVDAISDALKAVGEGRLNATVFQDAVGQGQQSVEVAVKHLKGETVDKEYMIPFQLVTPDNLSDFQ